MAQTVGCLLFVSPHTPCYASVSPPPLSRMQPVTVRHKYGHADGSPSCEVRNGAQRRRKVYVATVCAKVDRRTVVLYLLGSEVLG